MEYDRSRDLNSVALLFMTFDRSPHLFEAFKSKGEVPRPFSHLDAESLACVSRAVEASQNDRLHVGVGAD